ncbi:hypothetical protein PR202_gb27297 [Eleusine coracana subsp. coracana]|uniref:Folate-biopterin transporter 4 n=1 Tax=Eleusine coracana subsp. coracana TaxID=191504 RepID=A0AAV5FTV6_ELECO|nr:hypothetical protein PR202_gb27297 [Eleusine coracana subsp. coracana]
MRAAFGASFLWLVCFIYFIQGFRSFVWTAVSYQMKDVMKLSPSASQFSNLGSAMADVVIDAMVAEAVRAAGPEFAGDLQSLSWSSMAVGGIFGNLLGGYALSNLSIHVIYVVFSALPFFQLLSCIFVEDSPKGLQSMVDKHKHVDDPSVPSAETGSSESFRYEVTRRRKVPNISTVMFYYQTEVLHLEASFLGTARVIGWFSLMLGTYIYNRYFKHKKLRNILVFAHVGLAIISLLDIILVSGLHVQYGIADKYMVLWGSALADAINQFKMMPFLILSGQLCPPGIEGTLFALFMSINNFGSTLGSFLGAALTSALNISTTQFDNLALGLAVQTIGTLLPIGFLFLIPKEVTGLTS